MEFRDPLENPLSVITSSSITKPPSLSPMCGWQKEETISPKKISPLTPTKRRTKASIPDEIPASHTLKRELLPMCYGSPSKTKPANQKDELLYMKVPDLKFSDLDDWSKRSVCRVTRVNPSQGLVLQKDFSGSTAEVNQELIALFRYGDCVFAINEKCPHAGGPLHLGDIEVLPDKVCVTCPWHKWKMNLSNGKIVSPLGRDERAKTYPTQLGEDDSIWIGFDNFSAKCFSMLDKF